MNGARLAVASQAVGIAEAAYREALRYAGERAQFGKTIVALPAVSRMLVSMKGEIEAARALIFETSVWVDTLKACEQKQAELEAGGPGAAAPIPPSSRARSRPPTSPTSSRR